MRLTLTGAPEKLAKWATDGGAQIDEPNESEKATGWETDKRPPAGWFNWLARQAYFLQSYFASSAVANWFTIAQASVTDQAQYILYHPAIAALLIGDSISPQHLSVDAGRSWTTEETLGFSNGGAQAAAIDLTRFIIGSAGVGTNTRLSYSPTGLATSWTLVLVGVGSADTCTAIETDFPDSNEILIGTLAGILRFSTAVDAAFSAPTTPPTATASIVGLKKIGTTWYLLMSDGETWFSTDGGDNWVATTDSPADLAWTGTFTFTALAAGPDGTLVAVGLQNDSVVNGEAAIAFTHDGQTWTKAVIKLSDFDNDDRHGLEAVYYAGAGVYFAGGGRDSFANLFEAKVSTDNGETWVPVDMVDNVLGPVYEITSIASDGRRLWVSGTQNTGSGTFVAKSASIVRSE